MKKSFAWKKIAALMLAMTMFLSACGQNAATGDDSNSTTPVETTGTESTNATEPDEVAVDKSVYMDPNADVQDRIDALLAQMTLEEKVAQMLEPEQAYITPEQVKEYGIGVVFSGGGSAPTTGNSLEDWQTRVNDFKQAALDSRLGIPLLYGVDAVHGHNNVLGATLFPHNIGLGAANNPELMRQIGEVVAKEVRATGIQWTYAPTLGNVLNERWGRTYECFSERTEDVVALTGPYIEGFQGVAGTEEFLDEEHILACAKHYIGEGYTVDGINQGNVDMTAEEFDFLLESGVIDPYTNAINHDVLTVMVSYNSVDGLKCHENYHLIQEVLKDEIGFKGLVSSDYNAIQQVSGVTYKDQIELAVNAGIDLLMEVSSWETVMDAILQLVEEGRITEERINDAVSRILYVKFTAGLFEEEVNGATEQALVESFGSEEHRAVARQAVRESLVLLKNEAVGDKLAIDALQDAENIIVMGQRAFDIGSQCGGWTITWQGRAGNITQGTPIIQGFANQVDEGVKLAHNVDGTISEDNDAIIVVVGETPYAEMEGDRAADKLTVAANDQQLLATLEENLANMSNRDEVPVIGIIIAGRPVNITEYMDMFDAVVMAWLPGTEGDGVADVLFGDYDFTGTLTYTWMKDTADLDKKFEEGNEELVLFPYGYGLNKAGELLTRKTY